ncbi:MAG TPA: hypothetical protein VM163_11795 [bacterium]|nr:hypothetical protein [bacterium]
MSDSTKGGAILLVHWGSEVRTYIYSGFVEKLARHMPVTVVSRVTDGEFAQHLPEGVQVLQLPEVRIPPLFARLHALGNSAHGKWRESRGQFVSSEYYAFKPKPATFAGRARRHLSHLFCHPVCIRTIDSVLRQLGTRLAKNARPIIDLLEELQPKVVLSPDYMNVTTIAFVLVAQHLGVKTVALPQNWNNIYKCARVFLDCDRQLVWNERMRDFVIEVNPHLEAERVIPVGSPQFDFHANNMLIVPREEFAHTVGFNAARPIICYSAAAPKTVLHEAQILRQFLEAISHNPLFEQPQVVVRLNPIGSDPEFLELAREFPECYLCEPGWEVRRDVSWICSSLEDVKVWMNLIFHSALNISVPSTVTLDFAGMDRPVVNVAYDPPGIDRPLVSVSDLWKQDIYRPIVQGKVVEIASSPKELTDLVECFLRDPSRGRENRNSFIADEFASCFGKSGDRILSEIHDVLQER